MSENVVGLFGSYQQEDEPRPNATVVEELERLLEAAKAGEIVGLAGSFLHRDKVVTYSYAGLIGGYGLIGGLECLKDRLVRLALRQS